jgi:hypothetical protein
MRMGWEEGIAAQAELEAPAPSRSGLRRRELDARWDDLVSSVGGRFGVAPSALCGTSRVRAIARARAVLVHLAVHRLGLPISEVAGRLGLSVGGVHRAGEQGRRLAAEGPGRDVAAPAGEANAEEN